MNLSITSHIMLTTVGYRKTTVTIFRIRQPGSSDYNNLLKNTKLKNFIYWHEMFHVESDLPSITASTLKIVL